VSQNPNNSETRRHLKSQATIKRLRQKMEKCDLADPIENIRGRGFKLAASILPRM
jgi:DNA-binding response OmpR family regulator